MLKALLLLCTVTLLASESTQECVQPLTQPKHCSLSNLGYYGTGIIAFYGATLVISNKTKDNPRVMIAGILAGVLGSWLFKETFRDMGLTWIDLKKELNEYKIERDEYSSLQDVELTSSEKTFGELAQSTFLFPKYYWREMISLPSALLLLNYAYKALLRPVKVFYLN